MKSAKKSILKAVAKVGAKSAEIGASSASMLGYHQPKEPNFFKLNFKCIILKS